MHTKLPLLALLLGSALAASAQKAVKTVPLKPEMKPYTWSMKPAADFFAETGLTAADSVRANFYRVGPEKGPHVMVEVGHLKATETDVVWWVQYANFKIKDLQEVGAEVGKALKPERVDGSNQLAYYLPDAYVAISSESADEKTASLTFDAIPLYQFMPPVEDAIAKLDSTWEQLITNATFNERTLVRDSSKVRVRITDVTPLVNYDVYYPTDGGKPFVTVALTSDGGGLAVLKWATKKYYDRFFDAFDEGQIWVSDTDKDWVRVGVLFDRGELLNMRMSQADFLEMTADDGGGE